MPLNLGGAPWSGGAGETRLLEATLVINIRERQFLADFSVELKKLERKGTVAFRCVSSSILTRCSASETRRPHPAQIGLFASVAERKALVDIKERADLIIDTSGPYGPHASEPDGAEV